MANLPVLGTISSYFGLRSQPTAGASTNHKGIDIASATGTPVSSLYGGTVTKVAYDAGGYGNYVVVENSSGISELFAHLSTVSVKKGQSVSSNSTIGKVGTSGNVTGSHLHYEIKQDGVNVDPLKFIENLGTGVTNSLSNVASSVFNIDDLKQSFISTSIVGFLFLLIGIGMILTLVPINNLYGVVKGVIK